MMLRMSVYGSIVLLALLAMVQQAVAVPLAPGGNVALGGTTSAARPELAGLIIHDELIPFQILGAGDVLLYEGTLQNRVVRSTTDGTLDFYYRVRDTQAGLNGILLQADTVDFTGWSTDVDYRTDSLGSKPTTRAQRVATGNEVSLIYGNAVFSGEESLFTFIKTDALRFTDGGHTTLRLQTGENVVLDTVIPSLVPEPASGALLVVGAVCALLFRRRRVGAGTV